MDTAAGMHALTNTNKPEVTPLEKTPFFTFLVVLSSVVFPLCLMCSIAYCCRHRVEKCLEVILHGINVIHDQPSSRARAFYTNPCKAGRGGDGHGLTGGGRKGSRISETLKGRVTDVRMKGKDVFSRIHGHRRFDDDDDGEGEGGEDGVDDDGVSVGADSLRITESNCHLYAKYGAGWTGLTPGGLLYEDKRIVDGKNNVLESCIGRDEYVRFWRRGVEEEMEGNRRMTSRLDDVVVRSLPDRSEVVDGRIRESEGRTLEKGHRLNMVSDVKRCHGHRVYSGDDEEYTREPLDLTHFVGISHQDTSDGDVFDTTRRVCDYNTLIDDNMAENEIVEGDGRDYIDDYKENLSALQDHGVSREQCKDYSEGSAKITKSHVPSECAAPLFLMSENCPSLLLTDSVVLGQTNMGDLHVAPTLNTAAVTKNVCLALNRTLPKDVVGMITVSDDITKVCPSNTGLSVHESRDADRSRHDEEKVGDDLERERSQSVALTSLDPLSLSTGHSTNTHQEFLADSRKELVYLDRHISTDPNRRNGIQIGVTMTSPPLPPTTADHPVNMIQEATPASRALNHVTYYTINEQDTSVSQPPTNTTTGDNFQKVFENENTKTRMIARQDDASRQHVEHNGHKANRKAFGAVFINFPGANERDVTFDQLHYDHMITAPALAFNGGCSPGLHAPPDTKPTAKLDCLADGDEMNGSVMDSRPPFISCTIDDGVVRSKRIGHKDELARQGKRMSAMGEYAGTSGRTWSPERDVLGRGLSILGVTEDVPPVYQDTTRPLTYASRDQDKPDRVTSNKRLSTTKILGFLKKATSPTHTSPDVDDIGSSLESGKAVVSRPSYDLKTIPDIDTVQDKRHEGNEKGDDVACSVEYLNEGEGKRDRLEGCDVGDEGLNGEATRYSAVEDLVGEGQGRDKIKMNIQTHITYEWIGAVCDEETVMGRREASSFCKIRDITEATPLFDDTTVNDNINIQEVTSSDSDNQEENEKVQELTLPNTDDIVNENAQQEVATSGIDNVVNDTMNEVTSSKIDTIVGMMTLAVMKDHRHLKSLTKSAGEGKNMIARPPSFLGKDTCINDTAVKETHRPSAKCLYKDSRQVHSSLSCPKEKTFEAGIEQKSLRLHLEELGCPAQEGLSEQRNIPGPDLPLNESESESTRICLDDDKKSSDLRPMNRRVRFVDIEKREKWSLGLLNKTRDVDGKGLEPSALRDKRDGNRQPFLSRMDKKFGTNDPDPADPKLSHVGKGKSHKQRRDTLTPHDLHIIDNTHNNVNVGIPNYDDALSSHARGSDATLTQQTSPFSDISSLSAYETASESLPGEANTSSKRTYSRRSFKVRLSAGHSNLHKTDSGRNPRDKRHNTYFQDSNDYCSGLRPVLNTQHALQHEITTDLHKHRPRRKRKPSVLVRHLAGEILHHV